MLIVKHFPLVDPAASGVSIDLELVSHGYIKRPKMMEFPTKEQPRLAGGHGC